MKLSNNIWICRQQCPCGDWKCHIKYEGDERSHVITQSTKTETSTSSSSEFVVTPYVGQVFKTDNEAFEYYNKFARKNGFSIRKARSSESHSLGIYRRDFVCHRSGFNKPRKKDDVEHHRDRKSVRCGCDAKLYLTKEVVDGNTQWYVSQYSNVHNHELLEDDHVRLLPAYRKIPEADQERILLLSKAGFPVNRIVKVLESEKGVQPGKLPFIEKDVRNFVHSCKNVGQENDAMLIEKKENDIVELLEACKSMRERDGDFIYDFGADENGKIENVAWAFGDAIRAYTLFGDVVTFDFTYRSMTHGILLGLCFGMNNNGKANLLSCFLLQDETCHSFTWALQTFVRFLQGRQHPQTIVTDFEPALRDAISSELPCTRYVICLWHIIPKLRSWFALPLGLHQYDEFKSDFEMLSYLENVEDFEHQWNHFIARFGLVSDRHIDLLYSYRASWAFSYIRCHFLARTMTMEYKRSLDAFMNSIVSAQTCLRVFFEQVGVAANARDRNDEEKHYFRTKTYLPVEEHARNILSPYAFKTFQNELILSLQYATTEMPNGSYLMQHYKRIEGEYLVIWIPEDEQIHCSCKGFERSGILCSHALRLLIVKNYFQIPEKYFPFRWRRKSSLVGTDDQNTKRVDEESYRALHFLSDSLLTESLVSKSRFDYVRKELTMLLERIRNMPTDEVSRDTADISFSES